MENSNNYSNQDGFMRSCIERDWAEREQIAKETAERQAQQARQDATLRASLASYLR
jgi:hypothetical protein